VSLDDLVGAGAAIREAAAQPHPWLLPARLAGVGWATVDCERAAGELRAALGRPDADWVPATGDPMLGAAAWRFVGGKGAEPAIVLLEPDTEGRLAASLARFGEAVAVVYLAASGAPAAALSRPEVGPLGPGRLLLGRPAWGPHVIVLAGDAIPPEPAPPR